MKKLALIIAMTTLLPFTSQAQEAIYLSGMLGMTSFDVADSSITYDTELSFGARGGVLFNEHIAAGIYIQRYATDNASVDLSTLNLMAEVSYYFNEAEENGFWVSGLLGVTNWTADYTAAVPNDDDSETAFGGTAGYHFMVAPNFSISPQVTYIYTNTDTSSFTQLSGLVNVTFWL